MEPESALTRLIFSAMQESHAPVGELIVCPTPIGNLGDVTLRALDALRTADVIACEDTRRTGALLTRLQLRREGVKLVSLHEHNERQRCDELLRSAGDGARIVLVSDAGTPLISDPGFALVASAIANGVPVTVLPGPSAVIAALVASGLPPARFQFEGFLPRDRSALVKQLQANSRTLVAFESPKRLPATLALLAELDGARPTAVCRELSKLHEEVARGSASELALRFGGGAVRGEIVLVIGAASAKEPEVEAAAAAVRELIAAGARPRAAAKVVARLSSVSANALYALAIDAADSLGDR
jgi:16S rRNA (cytidine1402-2'-O)-methyltransferase